MVRVSIELDVNDSADAAGVMIDMIRCAKLALDRKIAGPLISVSSYYAKHPPKQYPDEESKRMLEEFIRGERDR
jgi:myo-inositol-1-phosphate synthase